MKFQEPKTKPYCDLLKHYIIEQLKYEFEEIFLSHNLIDTMEVNEITEGYIIDIPAEVYDIDIYKNKKIIVYTGEGSYADEVDISGGFSGKHKNYVARAITKSMKVWEKRLKALKLEVRKYRNAELVGKVTLANQQKWYRNRMHSNEIKEIKAQNRRIRQEIAKFYRGKRHIKVGRRSIKIVKNKRVSRARKAKRG